MTDVFDLALRYVLCGAIGYTLGAITMYRRAKIHGIEVIVPYVPRNTRSFTALVLVLSMVTAFQVISGQIQSRRADECDRQFREAITAAATINTEDRELEREDDRLRTIRDEAVDELVRGIAALADGDTGTVDAAELFARYDAVVDEEHRQREELDERRAELQKARDDNPYPAPTCGL